MATLTFTIDVDAAQADAVRAGLATIFDNQLPAGATWAEKTFGVSLPEQHIPIARETITEILGPLPSGVTWPQRMERITRTLLADAIYQYERTAALRALDQSVPTRDLGQSENRP